MTDSLPDAEVVRLVLAGDRESFAILVERYQHAFAAYAINMTGTPDDAADVIQESLVRAFRFLNRCQDPANFKAWLFRIVSNQCKTYVTRGARRRTLPLEAGAEVTAPDDPAHEASVADLQRRVRRALLDLPTDQREALLLKYVEGLSLPEMAEVLNVSVPALKMRLLRGRENLRDKLEGLLAWDPQNPVI
ncbi:MAG: sigma-70 family RNA polymerase sigma factor [Gemmatimonadetes bacterium]|nr:sigma-70 family RNA polymerase sigma factor [Gemmatimonadota bacterium]